MEKREKEKGIFRILSLFHENINVSEIELTEAYKYIFENSDFLPFLNDAELAETVIYLREEIDNNGLVDISALETYFNGLKVGYATFIESCIANIELEDAEQKDLRLSVGTNILDDLFYDYQDDKWKLGLDDIFQQILHQPWMSGVDVVKKAMLKTFENGNSWKKDSDWDAKVIVVGNPGAGKSAVCKFQYVFNAEVIVKGIVANNQPGDTHYFDFGGSDLFESNWLQFYNSKAIHGYLWNMQNDDVRVSDSDDCDLPGSLIESCGMSLKFVDNFNCRPRQYNLLFLDACYSISLDIDFLNEDLSSIEKGTFGRWKKFIQPITGSTKRRKVVASYSKKAIEYVHTLIQHLQPLVEEGLMDRPAGTD